MIAYLEGKIIAKEAGYVVLFIGASASISSESDASSSSAGIGSGIGYKVMITSELADKMHAGAHTSLQIFEVIREDAQDLYGFADSESLNFFKELINISGIGPKTALSIMNLASIKALKNAIASGEPARLVKVSGMGKKNAEKIVLELRDKVVASEDHEAGHDDTDSIEALKALGYSEKQARDALKEVSNNVTDQGKRIKEALKLLGRQ